MGSCASCLGPSKHSESTATPRIKSSPIEPNPPKPPTVHCESKPDRYDLLQQDQPEFSLTGQFLLAYCVSVYDGDTVTLNLETAFGINKWKIRLLGLDAPELKTVDPVEKSHGRACGAMVKYILWHRYCLIRCYNFEKYGRLLGEIYVKSIDRPADISAENRWWQSLRPRGDILKCIEEHKFINLNEWLMENTPCVSYEGQTKSIIKFKDLLTYHNIYAQIYQEVNNQNHNPKPNHNKHNENNK